MMKGFALVTKKSSDMPTKSKKYYNHTEQTHR